MANGRGKHKAIGKRRTKVVSRGTARMSQHPLTEVEKAILGKGIVQSTHPVDALKPWTGVGNPREPFDAEQAKWNRENLPFLKEYRDG